MNAIFLYAVIALMIVVFVVLHFEGNKKGMEVGVIPKMPKFGSKPRRDKPMKDHTNSQLSFTPYQIVHLINRHGLFMLDNKLLDKYPILANCCSADGFPCLCSAALWSLYNLKVMACNKENSLFNSVDEMMDKTFPDIAKASLRALDYFNHYDDEKIVGLIQISNNNLFSAYSFVIAQWLYIELTQNDVGGYTKEIMQELSYRLKFWFVRIPDLDMIQSES